MEILVDTSVWIGHFIKPNSLLIQLLQQNRVVIHSVIIGEIAVGGVKNQQSTLDDLIVLPQIIEVQTSFALHFLEKYRLVGIGLSWADILILSSAHLNGIPIWSDDVKLHQQASILGLAMT